MLNFDDFQSVTLEDKELFDTHFRQYPQIHSDNSFTNMVCWNHYADYRYVMVQDSMVISSTIEGETSFRGPIGPTNPKLLKDLLTLAIEKGGKTPYFVFDKEIKQQIEEQYPSISLHQDRNFFDYVYQIEELANLKGRKYLNIRKQINKFKKNCEYTTEFISPENISSVSEFIEKWCEWKHCDEHPVMAEEKEATLFAVSHFFELDLKGIIIRVDDKISSIAIFEILNADTVVIHFEKGLPGCDGNYKVVNQETALMLRDKYLYINRESDLGVEGLREAKVRYHPDHFAEVHYTKKEEMNLSD